MRILCLGQQALVALAAAALTSAPAQAAEPKIKEVLKSIYGYDTTTSFSLLKNGALVGGTGQAGLDSIQTFVDNKNAVKASYAAQTWQVNDGGVSSSFTLEAKYAGHASTFGIFNPPASTLSSAPSVGSFGAIFSVPANGQYFVDGGGAPDLTSHLKNGNETGGISGGAQFGDTNTDSTRSNGLTTVDPTSTFTVNNFGDPFAFGIYAPVTIGDSSTDTSLSGTGYSSVNSQNGGGFRQMLTFEIKKGSDTFYVLAFEDLIGGDYDYNDLLIELTPVAGRSQLSPEPEPVSMAMFGAGFLGLAGFRLRQRRLATSKA